jgi:hypothetical protein
MHEPSSTTTESWISSYVTWMKTTIEPFQEVQQPPQKPHRRSSSRSRRIHPRFRRTVLNDSVSKGNDDDVHGGESILISEIEGKNDKIVTLPSPSPPLSKSETEDELLENSLKKLISNPKAASLNINLRSAETKEMLRHLIRKRLRSARMEMDDDDVMQVDTNRTKVGEGLHIHR